MNAHYTSPEVITGMWRALTHFGFKGGRVLEPSAGIGHFIGLMPEAMAANSDGRRLNWTSSPAPSPRQLYQGTDVRIEGFEKPIFRTTTSIWRYRTCRSASTLCRIVNTTKLLVHDYFFVRRSTAFVLAAWWPSSPVTALLIKSGVARRMMDERGEFVGAVRLPGGNKGCLCI